MISLRCTLFYTSLILLLSCRGKEANLNVIVIYTDDQRHNTIHALGNPDIITPHMDRLVKMGTSFTRAHVMGSMHGAVCAPSRAMLLSGQPYFDIPTAFINQGASEPRDFDFITWPEQLREAGYSTFFTGKWHNNVGKLNSGFQTGENIFIGGMHFPKNGGHKNPELWDYDPSGKYTAEGKSQRNEFSSTLYTNAALQFINKDHQDPFCLYVAYTSPHDPREAPEQFLQLYDSIDIALPYNYKERHPFDNGHLHTRDEQLLPLPRKADAIKKEIKAYYAMITEVDHQLGRILDQLEKKNLLDKTLIVFAGDNGLAVGQHGLLGKQSVYDHSVRIPLIMAGPGIPSNNIANSLCYIHDIYPTLMDLLGKDIPTSVSGNSLVPAMLNNSDIYNSVFLTHAAQMRGIRTKNDKKIIQTIHKGKNILQYFDLNTDPDETNNLINNEAYEDEIISLQKQLTEHILSTDSNYFKPQLSISHTNWTEPNTISISNPFYGIELMIYKNQNLIHNLQPSSEIQMTIDEDVEIVLQNIRNEDLLGPAITYKLNDITQFEKVIHLPAPAPQYLGNGNTTLVDGLTGGDDFKNANWLGFISSDTVSTVIEWTHSKEIESVIIGYLHQPSSWIFAPKSIHLIVRDQENKIHDIQRTLEDSKDDTGRNEIKVELPKKISIKKLELLVINHTSIPDWHEGAGTKPWLFLDEISMN